MYFKTLVTKWEGVGRCSRIPPHAVGQEYVFNVHHITQLKAFGVGSEFLYAEWPYDRKTGYAKIQCTTAVSTIKNEYDIPPVSNIVSLSVFPNKNPNNTPETVRINAKDISYAWANSPAPQYSWVRYCLKGGRDKIVLANKILNEVLDFDYNYETAEYQWPYYVDLAESIGITLRLKVDYETVTIGSQVWMARNWDGLYAGSVSANGDSANDPYYGRLYNYAMITAPDFAPAGYRLPTKAEFETLFAFVSNNVGPLKEVGTTYWASPNGVATNSTGFGLRGAGESLYTTEIGFAYIEFKTNVSLWTSTAFDASNQYISSVDNTDTAVNELEVINTLNNNNYLSVRFIKD